MRALVGVDFPLLWGLVAFLLRTGGESVREVLLGRVRVLREVWVGVAMIPLVFAGLVSLPGSRIDPERPFVLLGQQYVADPSRSQGTANPIYAYAHVPHGYTGDATEAVTAQIERFAPGFRDRILATVVRTPAEIEQHNANWVGGDIATGASTARQIAFRPRLALNPYSLGAEGLYLCSSATPPGAGVHGMGGFNAAEVALRRL